MEPKIKTKIISGGNSGSLEKAAQSMLDEGWRPIGGPFWNGEDLSWAFILIPTPPPKPEPPPPTREELIKAASEGTTIVRDA